MGSTKLVVIVLAGSFVVLGLVPANSKAESPVVMWENIVGIVQAANLVGSGTGQVVGGAQPWTTKQGFAEVNLRTGMVKFLVQGLVFAGGNSVGTRGAVAQVKGTLICDTNGSAGLGNSVLVDTELVPLDDQGEAQFVGDVGPLPPACLDEPDVAFLVRTAGGNWIANGAVRRP
jgi:hypothetical protein